MARELPSYAEIPIFSPKTNPGNKLQLSNFSGVREVEDNFTSKHRFPKSKKNRATEKKKLLLLSKNFLSGPRAVAAVDMAPSYKCEEKGIVPYTLLG